MSIASHRLNRILVSTMLSERENDRRASEDVLTGLANRAGLQSALERICSGTREHDTPAALLYMDMDDFKIINDTHGHAAGDQVLKTIADRMRACCAWTMWPRAWAATNSSCWSPASTRRPRCGWANTCCRTSRIRSRWPTARA